ncbi:hypothetical protein Tco_0709425 [Tanacetum coccineum]
MAESSSQNSLSPNLTPKEEPVTLDKPNSPNLFLLADLVEFTFDEMLFTTNNEVARIHPYHLNSAYFQIISDFISKSLENSRIWVSTPTGGIIGYKGEIRVKEQLKKELSSLRRGDCTKPGAKPGHKKQSTSSKHHFVSSREATKGGSSKAPTGSKTSHSQKRKESSSAMDSNPSQPSVSTHLFHFALCGLHHDFDASSDFTIEDDPGISAPKDSISLTTGYG